MKLQLNRKVFEKTVGQNVKLSSVQYCKYKNRSFHRIVSRSQNKKSNYLDSEAGKFLTSQGLSSYIQSEIYSTHPETFEQSAYELGLQILRYKELGFNIKDIESIIQYGCYQAFISEYSKIATAFMELIVPFAKQAEEFYYEASSVQLVFFVVDCYYQKNEIDTKYIYERLENVQEVLSALKVEIKKKRLTKKRVWRLLHSYPLILLGDCSELQQKFKKLYLEAENHIQIYSYLGITKRDINWKYFEMLMDKQGFEDLSQAYLHELKEKLKQGDLV